MRKRSEMGVSGTVSALLTVLLLVAGFAVSTGLLSAIYSAQSEVLRKAVNVGEAVSERLQAFVYEDVRTNRTLLTVRNVGSVGSEIEYLMAVGYDGSVLVEARPGDTIKLGTQQAFTLFLSDLLGPGFDNYTEVRSRMATLYLKTVKGGVFGSGYMAPPSVMTAAYATSTTTISTTESSVTNLPIETGTETITWWTATVILDNPDHWPVEAYVGVAFADRFRLGYVTDTDGFPNWGLQPGLAAKNSPSGSVTNVTSASQIKLPKVVTCWLHGSGINRFVTDSLIGWGGSNPVHKYSELGPTYINLRGNVFRNRYITCGEGDEVFDPRGTTVRLRSYVMYAGQGNMARRTTTVTTRYTTYTTTYWTNAFTTLSTQWEIPLTAYWTVTNPAGTRTTTFYTWTRHRTTLTLIGEDVWATPITELSTTITATYRTTITTTWQTPVDFGPTTTTITGPVTATRTLATTVTGSYARTLAYPGYTYISYVAEVGDAQVASFPRTLVLSRNYFCHEYGCYGGDPRPRDVPYYFEKHYFDLAYIKVVNLWNTTNVLAYVDGRGGNAVALRVDRPIGITAVYVYSRTEARLPPPPPPPPGRENYCIDKTEVCPSFDAGTIRRTSDTWDTAPEGQCDGQVTVRFVREGGDSNCGAWIAPGAGTYTSDQLQRCPENNGQITCTVPAGSTIIHGCARRR